MSSPLRDRRTKICCFAGALIEPLLRQIHLALKVRLPLGLVDPLRVADLVRRHKLALVHFRVRVLMLLDQALVFLESTQMVSGVNGKSEYRKKSINHLNIFNTNEPY